MVNIPIVKGIFLLMHREEKFKSILPNSVFVDLQHTAELSDLIHGNNWIEPSAKILSVEKPGEGNMNFVARIKTESSSIIVKQSRPWVEKYPQLEAPVDRIFAETEFYKAITSDPFCKSFCPEIIGFDPGNFLLALQDLGEGTDCSFMYKRNSSIANDSIKDVIKFISRLHNASFSTTAKFPDNTALKRLNHTHIFHYPFLMDNGFNLDNIQEGLQAVSLKYKDNAALKSRLEHLGDVYLRTGQTLIHGDFYPGSWLITANGIKIIDPEFSYMGQPEFDLGVMMAHLKMCRITEGKLNGVLGDYKFPIGFDPVLFKGFCGAEIMRRIIGLAQLPVDLSITEKSDLLVFAEQCIMNTDARLTF
ncbi:MAG: aminoglycoside phosphotransferase [Marivirga sp.]|nr:aminoglycoside phosphotransferase [Marivirga sp.]